MSIAVQGLQFGLKKNLDWAQRLTADLSPEQMTLQPPGDRPAPVNHPAWIFSHLNVYLPVMAGLLRGETFEDPKFHPFGMQSKPEADASVYASKEDLLKAWNAGHEELARLLSTATDATLLQPVTLPRWREIMPTAGIVVPYLLLVHENQHLGQLSAWRRVLGLPPV
ncbi:MAG: DinB family protein [Planctomycetota bacterium]|jgi:hypothetical protein|nr:DinB family protein [Blastopirellula sp.]